MKSWHCTLHMDATAAIRPGTLARICSVFSERGISIRHLDASGDDPGSEARISLSFTATPVLAEHLRRRLTRLACAHTIDLEPSPAA